MKIILILLLTIVLTMVSSINGYAQTALGSEFTYQGELNDDNGNPHNGQFDFKFVAFDTQNNGTGSNLAEIIIEDIDVINGLFTTHIDLGNGIFMGDNVWLEVNVRTGVSIGGFTKLLPRQQVTATPYATHAQFVGSDAISTLEIQDGSIATVDLANNSITTEKIANSAVGVNQINTSQVQQRVSGVCGANEFIKSINQNGTVMCAVDVSGLTTVTSADIVDATIGQVDLANNIVGEDEIIASEVQLRIGGTCDDGFYLSGINQDGSVICNQLPIGLDFSLTGFPDVGLYSSIAIGSDNNPIISYYDLLQGDLRVYKCSNSICSHGSSILLDSIGDVGEYSSIAIGDNNPFISYFDRDNNDLKLYICSNPSCSLGSAKVLDSSGVVGQETSIAIGNNNTPVISYYDATNGDLKAYKCANESCFSGGSSTLDSAGFVGRDTSIYIGDDNFPIISYRDASNNDIKVYKCANSSCSGAGTTTIIADLVGVGLFSTSITNRDSAGSYAIISYSNIGLGGIKVYYCTNLSCSTGFTRTPVTTFGNNVSIALSADSNHIISYFDQGGSADLNVFKCTDQTCLSGDIFTLDTLGQVGRYSSIAIGNDNKPIISYYDETKGALKVYSCGNEDCSN